MTRPFCSLPWNGIHIDQQLDVYFCCLMADGNGLGNLKNQTIDEIRTGDAARAIRESFLDGVVPDRCSACQHCTGDIVNDFTEHEKQTVLADRIVHPTDIHAADIRSSNLCTLDCIYCNSFWSSTIARREGKMHLIPSAEQQRTYQSYIDNIDLRHCRKLFLAGGEPLLMKEYINLLNETIESNPDCYVFVNTGLSVIDTPVFDLLSKLKNVTWMISVDNTDPDKFAYIRHGNTWDNFTKNLKKIQSIPGHSITAHMVYFSLSYKNFDVSVETLRNLGVNNILIDPVSHNAIDIRNVPGALDEVKANLESYLTRELIDHETYNKLISRINMPYKSPVSLQYYLTQMDVKYNMDSKTIFPELY